MKKETLTVEKSKRGTITYRNAEDELHNPNEPAVVRANGHKEHWFNGKRHNANGPAVIWHDGDKWYYINGKRLTGAKFKAWQAEQTAPLHNKTKVIDGIEYKLTAK